MRPGLQDFRLHVSALLLLATAGVSSAVPKQSFEAITQELKRSADEKQLWLQPDVQKELKGDFTARLLKDAETGDIKSQATLGLCYHIGFGVKRDPVKAAEWYQKAADAGHAGAQNNLAMLLESGAGGHVDLGQAQVLFLAAAQQGHAEAEFNAAQNYALGIGTLQDWEKARSWYEKAAAQGSLAAMNKLGDIYLSGSGVKADARKAREYFQQPAEAGILSAQFNLSTTYMVENNFEESNRWMQKSAEGGYAKGQYYWAIVLASGKHVTKDTATAIKYARKAVSGMPKAFPQLVNPSHCLLARLLLEEQPGAAGPHGTEAFREASAAADTGYADGQHLVGICYHRGAGVPRDLATAAHWYRLAAEKKHVGAASSLAVLLEHGKGVPLDLVESLKWYRLAATGGDGFSQYKMGLYYRDGVSVKRDLSEALKWLRLAQIQLPDDPAIKKAMLEIEEASYKTAPEKKVRPGEDNFKAGVAAANRAENEATPIEEALTQLEEARRLGHPYAAAVLAKIYRRGTGVPQDPARAESYIAGLEKTSDPVLLFLIAMSYVPGGRQAVTENVEKVITLLRRSAMQGYPPAQNALGFVYMSVSDGHQNMVEAVKWLTLAKQNGDRNAPINLRDITPLL